MSYINCHNGAYFKSFSSEAICHWKWHIHLLITSAAACVLDRLQPDEVNNRSSSSYSWVWKDLVIKSLFQMGLNATNRSLFLSKRTPSAFCFASEKSKPVPRGIFFYSVESGTTSLGASLPCLTIGNHRTLRRKLSSSPWIRILGRIQHFYNYLYFSMSPHFPCIFVFLWTLRKWK